MEKSYYVNIFDKKSLVLDKDGSPIDLTIGELESANLHIVLWNLDFEIYDLAPLNFFERRKVEKSLTYGDRAKISIIRDLPNSRRLVYFFEKTKLMEKLDILSEKNKIKGVYLGIDLVIDYVLESYTSEDLCFRVDFGKLYLDVIVENGNIVGIDKTTEDLSVARETFNDFKTIDDLIYKLLFRKDLKVENILPKLILRRYKVDTILESSKFIALAFLLLIIGINIKSYRSYRILEKDYMIKSSNIHEEKDFEEDSFLDLILDIIENVPENVYVENLELGEESYIVGFSNRLKDIFVFKNKLNENYKDLKFTLTNYNKSEDGIQYTIRIR